MKEINGGKQMRSDWWVMPHVTGPERLRVDGKKAHSTQKPEALLYRVIVSSSNPGDVILDPFFGTGTTGAVAKKLHRQWIGIEKDPTYAQIAQERIDAIEEHPYDEKVFDVRGRRRKGPRVPFARLLENGLLSPGQSLFFKRKRDLEAKIKPDGKLVYEAQEGSIHQLGRELSKGHPCNGWEQWYFEDDSGMLQAIDVLRQILREQMKE